MYEVQLQRPYSGPSLNFIISPELAAVRCAELGAAGLLSELNRIHSTVHTMETAGISSLLEECLSKSYDFGTAYAHLRPFWNLRFWLEGDHSTLRKMFSEFEENDHATREKAQIKGTIMEPRTVPPRRLWDLYAHRVVPGYLGYHPYPTYWPVSHSWTNDMVGIETPVNGYEWPVPMPTGITLEMIRNELLNLGASYAWLDVVCLRQKSPDPVKEEIREEEWQVDVPTIGNAYQFTHGASTVQYCNGLGRPFRTVGWDDPRHWLNRAWTLQEINLDAIIGGVTKAIPNPMEAVREDGDCTTSFQRMMQQLNIIMSANQAELFMLLEEMKRRSATNTIDKIAGLGYLLSSQSLPAYYASQSPEDAWNMLVDHMLEPTRSVLLFVFPSAGDGRRLWMPSWKQIVETDLLSLRGQALGHEPVQSRGSGSSIMVQHRGYRINKCFIRGLGLLLPDAEDTQDNNEQRVGFVEVEAEGGEKYKRKIQARHRVVIPDGWYTLAGDTGLENWVVCQSREVSGTRLRKVSVVTVKEEGFDELVSAGVAFQVWNPFV